MKEEVETPYRRAKQEWDRRMGDTLAQARAWRMMAMLLLGICMVLVLGVLYYSSLPRRIPYVIELDSDGEASYKGNIGLQSYSLKEREVRYYMKKFIEYTRTLSSDVVVVKKNWREAYYFLTPTGASILNTYAQELQPLVKYKTTRVDIKFNSILAHSEHTRQVNWTEFVWNENGEMIDKTYWRGILKYEERIPSTEEHLSKNPLGFFIDTFNWTEVDQ